MWLSFQNTEYNPFAHLENIESNNEKKQADADYNEPLKKPLADQKASVLEGLYWIKKEKQEDKNEKQKESTQEDSFKLQKEETKKGLQDAFNEPLSDEKNNKKVVSNEKQQQELNLEKFKENPNYPILERFTKIPWIKKFDNDFLLSLWDKLGEKKLDKEGSQLIDIVKEVNSNLKKEWKWLDDTTMTYLDNYLNKVKELNKDKPKQVEKNWEKKYELPKEFESVKELSNVNDEVVQLLIKNYTKFPDEETWNPNFKKDILTTFEITSNNLIDWKQFERNEWFEKAMKDVKNWDIETRFFALKYLHAYINTSEWVKWLKSWESFDNIEEWHEEEQEDYTQYLIEKYNVLLNNAIVQWNDKEIDRLQEKINSLEKDKDKEKSKWEVFKWWEIDKINENDPLTSIK